MKQKKTITIELTGMSDLFWVEEYGFINGERRNVGKHSGLYTSREKAYKAALDSANRYMRSYNDYKTDEKQKLSLLENFGGADITLTDGHGSYTKYYIHGDFIDC